MIGLGGTMGKPFEIAFYYQSKVLMKGAREPKDVFIRDSVLVEISTATVEDAPLAVDIEIPYNSASQRHQFLGFGGALYEDFRKFKNEARELSGEEALLLCSDNPELSEEVFNACNNLGEDKLWKKIKGQVYGAFPQRVHTLIESDRDRIVANLNLMASHLLLVDNRLFEQSPCPMIGVSMNSKRSLAGASVVKGSNNSGQVIFSPKRHAEAEQFIRDLAPLAQFPTSIIVRKFRDDLVGTVHEAEMNAIAVVACIRSRAEKCVKFLTADGFEALGRLMRLSKAAERHEPGSAGAIATELAAMRDEHCWLEGLNEREYWVHAERDDLMSIIHYGLESLLRTPGVNLTADDDVSLSSL